MVDPIRRRRADSDVLLGTDPPAPEPPISDVPLDVIFQRVQATRDANRPADPVADDSTLGAIRRGIAAETAANQTPAANTRRARAQEARATAEARAETPISNMAISHNAADALTLGFADELYGAGRGAYNAATSGRDIEDEYRAARDQFRLDTARASAAYPSHATAGTILGTAGSLFVPLGPLGKIGQGATWGRRALGAAMLGAGFGAASGLGHSDVELADDRDLSDAEVGQLATDVAVPAAAGGAMGAGVSVAGDLLGGAAQLYRTAQDRRALNRTLGDRAQQIIESGEIPNLVHAPGDDVDMAIAAAADDELAGVDPGIANTIRGELTNILRENRVMDRMRASGVVGKPAMRRIAAMPGGHEGYIDVNDALGISPIGHVGRTSANAATAERIGNIARAQRNNVLAAADEAGVRVSGEDIAAGIRARMEPLRNSTSAQAARRLEDMERQAQVFEGRLMPDGTPNPDWTEITPRPRIFSQALLDEETRNYANLANYDRNSATLPPPDVANARAVRQALVEARDAALERWDPAQAQRFRNGQRALQNTLQITGREGQPSELMLRSGANRSFGITDMQAAMAGATAGSAAGQAIPIVGPIVGGGAGGLAGLVGNRIWRDVEPSVMATLAEGPIIQQRLRELGISSGSSAVPSGLAYLARQLQERGPRAAGMWMGDRDSSAASTVQAQDGAQQNAAPTFDPNYLPGAPTGQPASGQPEQQTEEPPREQSPGEFDPDYLP